MGCQSSAPFRQPQAQGRNTFAKQYTMNATIGEGSFGTVRQAFCNRTDRVVAVKVLEDRPGAKLTQAARHELRIWQHVGRSKYCVELLDSFLDDGFCYFVMDMCEANLMEQINEISRSGEQQYAKLFREMLLGICHLHERNIVHRDVKPHNFLRASDAGRTVRLCDYGLADRLPRCGGLLKGCYGTAPYMSVEMVADSGHSLSTDIWSFAAAAYVLVHRQFPFTPKDPSSKSMKVAILCGVPEPRFRRSGVRRHQAAVEEFIRAVLVRKAHERPSVDQALELPLLERSSVPGAKVLRRSGSSMSLWSRLSRGGSAVKDTSDDSTSCGDGVSCADSSCWESNPTGAASFQK